MTAAARTTQRDWIDAGLGLLRDGGEEALTIERLCASLGRTKGSFYHHFVDIAAYHHAVLGQWASSHTDMPIARADKAPISIQRRKALHAAVRQVDLRLELAVHAWAVRSPEARAAAQRVHARRIAYLAELRAGQKDALKHAELEYAAFLGSLHLHPTEPARRAGIATRMLALLKK